MWPDKPKLRTDLRLAPRFQAGEGFRYIAEDPLSGKAFEFGEREYFLLRSFQGQNSLSALKDSFEQAFGISLDLAQLEAFVRQLALLGLLTPGRGETTRENTGTFKSWILFGPNPFFVGLAKRLGHCFSTPFLAVILVIVGTAVGWALKSGRDLVFELKMLQDTYWYFLAPFLSIFIMGPLVETFKGIACVHYGGRVHAFSLEMLYRVVPHFYCDVSDAFWFMKKAERVRVFAAGIACQSLLWAGGVLAMANSDPAGEMHTFWRIFSLAATFLLFFRLNPLIEMDGYYLLMTWLKIPDLRNRARAYTKSWFYREPLPEPLTPRERVIFKRYGILSYLYELTFWCLALGLAGYHLRDSLQGVGGCIFLIILLLRFEKDLTVPKLKSVFWGNVVGNERGGIRFWVVTRFGLYGAFILLMFIPYPYDTGGDFKLLPRNELGIRAQVAGEIESVFVQEGQWVKKGQVLAKLTGRDQIKRIEELEATIEKCKANLAMLKTGAKPEEIEKARQEVKAAETSYSYSKMQADRSERMYKDKAVPEKDHENALRLRDVDKERLEYAKRDLELVKSGFRIEQIKAAEAEIRAYEVELRHERENLEMTTLVSPMEGRVITPRIVGKVGQYISIGELFAVVEDARTLTVEIFVPERELCEVKPGAAVKLRTWAYPTTVFTGEVRQIAPVAYERSRQKIERAYSEREWMVEQDQPIREKGKVVRVLCSLDNSDGLLKTDMTGYGKIEGEWRPVAVAFTRWLIRFLFVEVWSWVP